MNRVAWLVLAALLQSACANLTETVAVREEPERFVLVTLRNVPASLPSRAGSTIRGYDAATPYSVSARNRSIARALARAHNLREVMSWPIAATRVHCIVFELPAEAAREAILARLAREPDVLHAQPLNTFVAAGASGGYNDPYVDLQRSLQQMAIPAAHRWSRGSGVRVAVIDTGIDTRHPDLAGRVLSSRNFIDRDRARFDRDRHGTEVAGIIAALADNSVGIVGVAPEVQVLAIKACWQLRSDADEAVCNSFTLAQGLAAAIDARADLINLSVVGPTDPLLADLISEAARRGIIVVGAAGFPGRASDAIAVDVARPLSISAQHFYAPGDDIFTLTPTGGYGFASGSSLATAHVSGVVALLLSRNRHLRADEVRALLSAATRRLSTPLGDLQSINACAALAQMLGEGPCPEASQIPAIAATEAE
ncbi:MAG: S8 family peptidase [Gammaproteobacteria bacterium]